jgi:PAS domain S-box-containing protein
MRLRSHLVTLVLAVLVPMIAFSTIIVVVFGRQQRESVRQGAVETARALMSAADEHLAGSVTTLEALATLPSLDRRDLTAFHDDAARVLKSRPDWLTILLFAPDGRQLVNVLRPPGTPLPRVAEPRSFEAVLATRRPAVGDLVFGPITRQQFIVVRVPVIRGGNVVYVLTAAIRPASLAGVLARQRLSGDWVATVFDRNKRIVARTKSLDEYLGRPVSPEFVVLLDAGGAEGWAVTRTLEGVPVNTAFARSATSGWGIGLGIPAAAVAAPLRRSLVAVIGGGLAFVALALLLALVAGRRLAAPILALASAAKTLGERGDLPASGGASVTEIDELKRAFVDAAALRERADANARWLAAIVESSDDAIIGETLDGTITSWNPAATRMFGYAEAEAIGRPITLIVPPDRLDEEAEVLRRLGRGEGIDHFETVRMRNDGARIDVSLSISPIRDSAGRIAGASKIARDIRAQKRIETERAALLAAERQAREAAEAAERRASFLADVSAILGSSLDYDATLGRVARLAIPVLADLCAIDLVEPDGGTRRVAAAHVDPAKEALVREVRARLGFNPDAPSGVPAVLRTRRPAFVADVTEADLAAAARTPEQLAMFRDLGLKSWIIVPLIARGQILGALTFVVTESDRRYTRADLAFAESVAGRAALALDNARLYRDADAARRRAEAASSEARKAQREAEVFSGLTSAISASLELHTVLERVVNGAMELCDADIARIALRDPATDRMLFRYWVGSRLADRHPVEIERGTGLGGRVWQTGKAYRTDDHLHDPHRHPGYEALVTEEGTRASLVVPVRVRGEVEGLIFLDNRSSRPFTDRDEDLVERFAGHAAVAIQNARLLAAEKAARAEAETANRAKDEFLAVLSHELRTPLNAVYGWARMLRTGQIGGGAAERAIDAIIRNANAQVQLIDDLLDVSRVITGKMRLDVRPVDLHAVVEGALDAVRPAAEAKGIQLQSVLDPRAGPVTGDPNRLQQVVWNLLMNAVKFTPKGGRVQVHLQRVNSHVEIVVSDTGPGIPAEVLPFIFDRFRQGDSSSTRAHTGLGLGLALVKHLVELHGGGVTVQSPGEGKGAIFVVRLPLSIADLSASRAPRLHPTAASLALPPATVRLDGLRVLVVDDEADALELASAILTAAGATVRACSSVPQALEVLQQWRPDVLVSDIEMPGEDGYSLIRKVRALDGDRGGTTPAVALTAYGRTQDRMQSLTAGYSMHVPKPVDPGEFTAIIASLAARPSHTSGP